MQGISNYFRIMDYVAAQVFDYFPVQERVNNPREDPLENLSEQETLIHFRFGSDDLERLLNIIREPLHHADNRGQPLTDMQNLCIAWILWLVQIFSVFLVGQQKCHSPHQEDV